MSISRRTSSKLAHTRIDRPRVKRWGSLELGYLREARSAPHTVGREVAGGESLHLSLDSANMEAHGLAIDKSDFCTFDGHIATQDDRLVVE